MQFVQLLAQSEKCGANTFQRKQRSVGFYTSGSLHFSVPHRRANKKFRIIRKQKKITLETNKPNSGLKITVWEPTINKEISVSHALSRLINSGPTLTTITYVKKLNSPSTYFIHCNLIDKNQNFLNNNKSDLLATFDIKGKPYKKVSYDSSPQQPFRDCSTDSHVNNITVSVRNQDGELFDFNGLPLEFEFEFNFYLYNVFRECSAIRAS